MLRIFSCLAAVSLLAGCASAPVVSESDKAVDAIVAERLPLYGHRNWIVITDSAYPAQSAPGIETVVVHGSQAEVATRVLAAVKSAKHVRPNVYLDKELGYVKDAFAPGASSYRANLEFALSGLPVRRLPHEDIIGKLDGVSKTFRVLILKTDCTIPYSSVFIELECGYWSDTAERRLRDSIADEGK